MNGADARPQLPGNIAIAAEDNEMMNNDAPANPGHGVNAATASGKDHFAVTPDFKRFEAEFHAADEAEEKSPSAATGPVSTIVRVSSKIVKHIASIPVVASVGAVSIGYVMLFGQTMYSGLAVLLGLGLGSQRLEPATLLDYWEREGSKRSDNDKKVEGMFG